MASCELSLGITKGLVSVIAEILASNLAIPVRDRRWWSYRNQPLAGGMLPLSGHLEQVQKRAFHDSSAFQESTSEEKQYKFQIDGVTLPVRVRP